MYKVVQIYAQTRKSSNSLIVVYFQYNKSKKETSRFIKMLVHFICNNFKVKQMMLNGIQKIGSTRFR